MPKKVPLEQTSQNTKNKLTWIFKLVNKKRKKIVEVDFTPVKAINENKQNKVMTFSIIPQFNADRKFYTPAFFNPYQGIQDQRDSRLQYMQMKINMTTQISLRNIFVSKPRQKTYCQVCQCQYRDYLEHIESLDHSTGIKFSRFNNDIIELVQTYGQKQNKQGKGSKYTKKITKSNH